MSDDYKAIYRNLIHELWNRGKLDQVEQRFDAEYRRSDTLRDEMRGPHALRDLIQQLRSALSDMEYQVDEVITEGDVLAARWTLRGRHTGELFGHAPTGGAIQLSGVSFNHFRNKRPARAWIYWDQRALLDQLAGSTGPGFARVNGTELFYTAAGGGRPVMLLHGGMGLDHTYFRPWVEPLANRNRLVFYDHRGNGRSRRDPMDAVTHATWVADADGLRAHLGIDKVVLLGHSYGGFLALQYALTHPTRVAGLVLVSTSPSVRHFPEAIGGLKARASAEQLAALTSGFAPDLSDEQARAAYSLLAPIYFHRPAPQMLFNFDAAIRYSGAALAHSLGPVLGGYDVTARLREIRVPTLVVSGDDDWLMPLPEAAHALRDGIRGAELAVIRNAGHYPFIEQPGPFLTAVQAWLDRLG